MRLATCVLSHVPLLDTTDARTALQPLDESTSFGPLISAPQRDKVLGYISAGVEQGAELVTGGKKWQEENGGFYIEPTILTGCKPGMKVVEEEVRLRSSSRASLASTYEGSTRADFWPCLLHHQVLVGGGGNRDGQRLDLWPRSRVLHLCALRLALSELELSVLTCSCLCS